MHNRIKHTVLCIGLFAYVATVVSGSVDAVLCYGNVEQGGIKSQCCDHGNITRSVAVVSIIGGYDDSTGYDHNYCCTDIPVSTGKTEKYATKTNNTTSEVFATSHSLAISLPPASHEIKRQVFSSPPFSNDNSLDTVILLI